MNALLRDVSRSFYLSVRVLPLPMREPIAVAYLLARASDTLADASWASMADRLSALDGLGMALRDGALAWREDLVAQAEKVEHAGERRLLQSLGEVVDSWAALAEPCRGLVAEVVSEIISGQRLDVERSDQGLFPLKHDGELEDYCQRVAGCVGRFWTRIGFATLGQRFSRADPEALEGQGEAFGRGLQLINILRDLPADLRQGRCYLPAKPTPQGLLSAAVRWRQQARQRMGMGLAYAAAMRSWRLRVAIALPAHLGLRTLDRLDSADWLDLERGVKVDRRTVRRCMLQALLPTRPN